MINFAKIIVLLDSETAVTYRGYLPYLASQKSKQPSQSFNRCSRVVQFSERIIEAKFDLPEFSCTGINLLFHDYTTAESKLANPTFLANIREPGSYILLTINPSAKYNQGYCISNLGVYHISDATQEHSFNSREG